MSDVDAAPSVVWQLRWHYHCGACGWVGPKADFPTEPETCPCCGALPDGSNPFPEGNYLRPKLGWTCFHCGETFRNEAAARLHFGAMPDAEPGCLIKVLPGDERGLLITIRDFEQQLARYRDEDTDLHREIHGLRAEHQTALRREEEAGYARGMRDERERCFRIIARIKGGLRNGGARNACDHIATDLREGCDA